jgi:hypothetical protein
MNLTTLRDLAQLSAQAYNTGTQVGARVSADADPNVGRLSPGWRVLSAAHLGLSSLGQLLTYAPNGYISAIGVLGRAFVAINDQTHQMALVFRGTESRSPTPSGGALLTIAGGYSLFVIGATAASIQDDLLFS